MFDSGELSTTGKLPVTLTWTRPLSTSPCEPKGVGVNSPSPDGSPSRCLRFACPEPFSSDWKTSLPEALRPASCRTGAFAVSQMTMN